MTPLWSDVMPDFVTWMLRLAGAEPDEDQKKTLAQIVHCGRVADAVEAAGETDFT